MRQTLTWEVASPAPAATTAFGQKALLALAFALPVPAMAAGGLSLPLPGQVYRLAIAAIERTAGLGPGLDVERLPAAEESPTPGQVSTAVTAAVPSSPAAPAVARPLAGEGRQAPSRGGAASGGAVTTRTVATPATSTGLATTGNSTTRTAPPSPATTNEPSTPATGRPAETAPAPVAVTPERAADPAPAKDATPIRDPEPTKDSTPVTEPAPSTPAAPTVSVAVDIPSKTPVKDPSADPLFSTWVGARGLPPTPVTPPTSVGAGVSAGPSGVAAEVSIGEIRVGIGGFRRP
jgi:hypothetical protein